MGLENDRYRGFRSPSRAAHTLCCCGCLFWVFVLKLIIMLPATMIYGYVVGTVISTIHFVRLVPQLLWAIMIHQRSTWRIAILELILVMIPIALYPVFCVLAMTFLGLGIGFFGPLYMTFDESYEIWEYQMMWKESIWQMTESWWEFGDQCEEKINEFRDKPLRAGVMPFDITLTQIVVGVALMGIGAAVMLPFWVLITVAKFPLGVYILWEALFREAEDKTRAEHSKAWAIFCSPCLVLAFVVVVPLASVLYMIVSILHGVGIVLLIPIIYYDQSSILHTLWFMPLAVREFDRRTTGLFAHEWNWECTRWSIFECIGACNLPKSDESLTRVVDELVGYSDNINNNRPSGAGPAALCCGDCIA